MCVLMLLIGWTYTFWCNVLDAMRLAGLSVLYVELVYIDLEPYWSY